MRPDPIVTALGIGPFDLSAGLGVCYQPNHPRFQTALTAIRAAGARADKPVWMIGEPTAMLQTLLARTVETTADQRPRHAEGLYRTPPASSFPANTFRSDPRITPAMSSGNRSGVQPKQGMPIFASVSASSWL